MGRRYGASDDVSDAYQDRQPEQDAWSDEQQTIAEAVEWSVEEADPTETDR